jgi:predicted Ser/Thr protein kinase
VTADTLKKLGKYEIHGTLGKGAMGVVYDGFDPIIGRRVAIKTIAKDSMDPGEAAELLGRFKREAQAAGRLNHPGIVSIHDYGEDDGLAFIAMEFIKGNELRKYFESHQRFALNDIVHIMCEILDALDHAHRHGVVHRDIKPGNIMITDEGRVKVADFGVAWIESSTMTQVGKRIGTPAYMSPEQHQGLAVSGRSDLFSAGIILYQFLTGERPFTGIGYPLMKQILLQDPPPPSTSNVDIPRELDAVTMKALAKRPENRFATAREFAAAIRKAAAGEAVVIGGEFLLEGAALAANAGPGMPRVAGSGQGTTTVVNTSATGDVGSNPSDVFLEAELEYWKEIRDSTEAADFETFLKAFPGSRFSPLAQRRMNRLQAEAGQEKPDAAERAGIQVGQPGSGAAVGDARRSELERPHPDAEARARRRAEEQRRREEEKTRLLAEIDAPSEEEAPAGEAAGEQASQPVAEQARDEAEAREHDEAAPGRGNVVRGWRRIDGEEPQRLFPVGVEGDDATPATDLAPDVAGHASSDPVGPLHFQGVIGRPVHARRRGTKRADPQVEPVLAQPGFRPSRRPRRLPIAAALAAVMAVMVGGGIWYASQPELPPIVATLQSETDAAAARLDTSAVVEQPTQAGTTEQQTQAREAEQQRQAREAEQQTQAREAEQQRQAREVEQAQRERNPGEAARIARGEAQQAEQQRKDDEAARVAEAQRKKEEAARAAARENYELALALLGQGRKSEAIRLLRQLAYHGHGPAAKMLGDLYARSEEGSLEMQEAARFYAIAERNGVKIDRPAFGRR